MFDEPLPLELRIVAAYEVQNALSSLLRLSPEAMRVTLTRVLAVLNGDSSDGPTSIESADATGDVDSAMSSDTAGPSSIVRAERDVSPETTTPPVQAAAEPIVAQLPVSLATASPASIVRAEIASTEETTPPTQAAAEALTTQLSASPAAGPSSVVAAERAVSSETDTPSVQAAAEPIVTQLSASPAAGPSSAVRTERSIPSETPTPPTQTAASIDAESTPTQPELPASPVVSEADKHVLDPESEREGQRAPKQHRPLSPAAVQADAPVEAPFLPIPPSPPATPMRRRSPRLSAARGSEPPAVTQAAVEHTTTTTETTDPADLRRSLAPSPSPNIPHQEPFISYDERVQNGLSGDDTAEAVPMLVDEPAPPETRAESSQSAVAVNATAGPSTLPASASTTVARASGAPPAYRGSPPPPYSEEPSSRLRGGRPLRREGAFYWPMYPEEPSSRLRGGRPLTREGARIWDTYSTTIPRSRSRSRSPRSLR